MCAKHPQESADAAAAAVFLFLGVGRGSEEQGLQVAVSKAIDGEPAVANGPEEFDIFLECLARELTLRHIQFEREKPLLVEYKGAKLECGYRLDFLVANMVVVEVKASDGLLPIHQAQLLTYMKLGGWQVGLLINFQVPVLKKGIKRLVLNLGEAKPEPIS